jgi:hypothetical protein
MMKVRDERHLLRFQNLMAAYKLHHRRTRVSCRSPRPGQNCCLS